MKRRVVRCVLSSLFGPATVALFLAAGASAAPDLPAVARYVAPAPTGNDQGGANDCLTDSNPCATIQHAIDVAISGQALRIAGGTYYGSGGSVVVMTKTLTIQGGYSLDFSTHDPDLYTTTLDGQRNSSVISTTAPATWLYNLTISGGDGTGSCPYSGGCGGGIYAANTDLVVGACIITDNVGSTSDSGHGGGIYVDNWPSSRNVTVWGSLIANNTANADAASSNYGTGGGVLVQSGSATLVNNTVEGNLAHAAAPGIGGGIYLAFLDGADVLTNTIRNNVGADGASTAGYGGGMNVDYCSSTTVSGNVIESNYAHSDPAGYGGGMYVAHSDLHITRNWIVGNHAFGGGAVHIESQDVVTLSNNLIADNTALVAGGVNVQLGSPSGSRALLVNNTIADNDAAGVAASWYAVVTLTNCIIAGNDQGIQVGGVLTGGIFADTNLFWNASDPITGTNAIVQDPLLWGSYYLREGSPAEDAGLDIAWLTTDLDGRVRPSGACDLGAFEGVRLGVFLPLVLRSCP
jgi:hypothetical protein